MTGRAGAADRSRGAESIQAGDQRAIVAPQQAGGQQHLTRAQPAGQRGQGPVHAEQRRPVPGQRQDRREPEQPADQPLLLPRPRHRPPAVMGHGRERGAHHRRQHPRKILALRRTQPMLRRGPDREQSRHDLRGTVAHHCHRLRSTAAVPDGARRSRPPGSAPDSPAIPARGRAPPPRPWRVGRGPAGQDRTASGRATARRRRVRPGPAAGPCGAAGPGVPAPARSPVVAGR